MPRDALVWRVHGGHADPSHSLAVAVLVVEEDHVLQRNTSLLRNGLKMVILAALVDL